VQYTTLSFGLEAKFFYFGLEAKVLSLPGLDTKMLASVSAYGPYFWPQPHDIGLSLDLLALASPGLDTKI